MKGRAPVRQRYIWKRDGGKCVYCGESADQIDHVVPFSKGGESIPENQVLACHRCNYKKSGKLKLDFITRGLFYLSTVGENTDWVDKLKEEKATYLV